MRGSSDERRQTWPAAGLLSDVDLVDLGPRRLRDLAKPVELFQVRAPGLRTEFPQLKTLDATPGNLRPQTTSFVGRESELADVSAALKAHRLVTLVGVGSVGKTRLREVLGDNIYESLAHNGEKMTNANVAQYALEQIDLARAKLLPDRKDA